MSGKFCYTIYDELNDFTLPGEFDCLHDCLERIKELEEYYNIPNRFKYCYGYVYNLED